MWVTDPTKYIIIFFTKNDNYIWQYIVSILLFDTT